MAEKIKIYGELESATAEGIVADASAIRGLDDKKLSENLKELASGSNLRAGNGIDITDKVISVKTASTAEKDNTLPITSAAVEVIVGNIDILLGII